jgi:hypothetical protein
LFSVLLNCTNLESEEVGGSDEEYVKCKQKGNEKERKGGKRNEIVKGR